MKDQFGADDTIVLEHALAYWVNRYYQAARREMYRLFDDKGLALTPEQWMVLVRLWERDARTQQELCDATTRDAPTMSRILSGMVARGLVRRALDPRDKRARVIVLTDDGRAAAKVLVPVVRKLVERAEAGVAERDLEITRRTLRRLTENLE